MRKVLMISTDRRIFDENSNVGARMVMFGSIVEELHIIVLSLASDNLEAVKLEDNVFVYPTSSKNRWHYFRDAVRIGRELSDIDLVISQDPAELGSIARKLGRIHSAPVELQIHTDIFSLHFRAMSVVNRFRVYLAKHNIRRVNCVRVASDRVRRSVLVHASGRGRRIPVYILPVFVDSRVVQNASAEINLHEKYPQFDTIVLMASRFTKEKNIALGIEAFSSIVSSHERAGMLIVGDGPLLYDLQQKVYDLGLNEKIIFEKWTDDIPSYMRTADVYLLTSDFEGYGRTLVEAALVGCPIVTTDVGIAGGILHDGHEAMLCPVGDAMCVGSSLSDLVGNIQKRKELAENARQSAEQHVFSDETAYLSVLRAGWESCIR